jgi:hypothetical protein
VIEGGLGGSGLDRELEREFELVGDDVKANETSGDGRGGRDD